MSKFRHMPDLWYDFHMLDTNNNNFNPQLAHTNTLRPLLRCDSDKFGVSRVIRDVVPQDFTAWCEMMSGTTVSNP